MAHSEFFINQNIFVAHHPEIRVVSCHQNNVAPFMASFLDSVQDNTAGLAPVYGSQCRMSSLAVSSMTQVLVISLSSQAKKRSQENRVDISGLYDFLNDPTILKSAFHMDKLAMGLFFDYRIHISNAKDLLSLENCSASRESLAALMKALGSGEAAVNKKGATTLLSNESESHLIEPKVVALQAWAACCAASLPGRLMSLLKAPAINTLTFKESTLKLIAKNIRDTSRLVSLKPTRIKHEVKFESDKQGELCAISQRYKTKVMRTEGNQEIQIKVLQSNGNTTTHRARASNVVGRSAFLAVSGRLLGDVQSMETIGRGTPTSAEESRSNIMLQALQGRISLSTNPFIKAIWLPSEGISWSKIPKNLLSPPTYFPSERRLNLSQEKAVNAILSTDDTTRVVLIHGPPGTGKTTVIAASVTSVMFSSDETATLWLVAQSNVAVKNIAEKLASVDFLDFKVLVSKDYHFDWHEHQYEKIDRNLIRSDDFPADLVSAERTLLGSRVILCTLSMLSNGKLGNITRLVPLQTVIFDEASQIEIGDYFPMLVRFRPTLRKLVFIGDDKQLAPYGSSDIPDLESIFEKAHLRKKALLLDTQYRMPIPIGNFISLKVYKGLLKSQHAISSPLCCHFVNVGNGAEESKGHSWKNTREVDVAVKIASQLTSQGKSYRVITPYDPQRSLLENGLKKAKLAWEDKCFNVDSFQGNEDDYIIISVVRTKKLGFLSDMRRVNVMLTRCKKGMIICTNRNFIEGPALKSLVGQMRQSLSDSPWIEGRQVLNGVRPFI